MWCVDFFCGGGGMTRGLLDAGIQVIAGVDSNPDCRKTYDAMFKTTMNKELLDKLGALFAEPVAITSNDVLQGLEQLPEEAQKTVERYMKKWNIAR